MEKSQPFLFSQFEGGIWLNWTARINFSHPGEGIRAHAILFEDGSIFDLYNGWRPGVDPELTSAIKRIVEIDKNFSEAKHWGSWMVEVANEREALAIKWGFPHNYQARTANGGRVS